MIDRRILILGGSGQVGWELRHKLSCLGKIEVVSFPDGDFTKPETLRRVIQAIRPAVIVNGAA